MGLSGSSGFMSALKGLSVAAVSSGQVNVCQSGEVEIDDDFEHVGRGAFAEAFGQGGQPVGIVGLQRSSPATAARQR